MSIERRYDGEYESGTRGRSAQIFRGIDIASILTGNRVRGFGFANDFLSNGDISDWTLTDTTASEGPATFAAGDGIGGLAVLSAGSTIFTEGGQIQYGAGEMFIPAANKIIALETSLTMTGIGALNVEFFFGLSVEDTTVIGSSANTSANHIGFESVSDDGIVLCLAEKAGTRPSSPVTGHTFVSGTNVRLGIRVIGVTNIEFYVDGVLVDDTVLTANIPIVEMTPTLVVQSGGTDSPIATVDWVDCFQQDHND